MQQQVALLQRGEDVGAARKPGGPCRQEGGPAQFGLRQVIDQLVQPHEVDRTVDAEHGLLGQLELVPQQLLQRLRTGLPHFEANRIAEVALRQLHAHRLAQVAHFLFVDGQIRVARHAELREAGHLPARKQVLQVRAYGRCEQHECRPAAGQRVRHGNHARQHARHLQDGGGGRTAERVLALQLQDEVQRLVEDLRKRMRRVEPDRRQQRTHFALDVVAYPLPLLGRALRVVDDDDAALLERRHDDFVEQPVLPAHEAMRPRQYAAIDARRWPGPFRPDIFGQVGQPHLEELVQVGRDDADVAQSLGQGNVLARGHGEHALVEREQRQLAIEVGIRIGGRHGGR